MNFTELSNKELYLAPSILSADFCRLGDEISATEKNGVKILHFDVMDGTFVPNISFGMPVLKSIRPHSEMLMDCHLMIQRPQDFVADFAAAGCDHFTFHIESDCDADELIETCRHNDMTVGISIKPKTPLEEILPYLEKIDLVLVMTVEPGFGGQSFMEDMMDKVRQLRQLIDEKNLDCHIQVDGGIKKATAPIAIEAGANVFVAGSAFYLHPEGMAVAQSDILGQ